jgi:hypothetical protein
MWTILGVDLLKISTTRNQYDQWMRITMAKNRHMIQVDHDRWLLLWEAARKRKEPTQPADIMRELIDKHLGRKTKTERKKKRE